MNTERASMCSPSKKGQEVNVISQDAHKEIEIGRSHLSIWYVTIIPHQLVSTGYSINTYRVNDVETMATHAPVTHLCQNYEPLDAPEQLVCYSLWGFCTIWQKLQLGLSKC